MDFWSGKWLKTIRNAPRCIVFHSILLSVFYVVNVLRGIPVRRISVSYATIWTHKIQRLRKAWNDDKLSRFSFLYGYTKHWGLSGWCETGDISNKPKHFRAFKNLWYHYSKLRSNSLSYSDKSTINYAINPQSTSFGSSLAYKDWRHKRPKRYSPCSDDQLDIDWQNSNLSIFEFHLSVFKSLEGDICPSHSPKQLSLNPFRINSASLKKNV